MHLEVETDDCTWCLVNGGTELNVMLTKRDDAWWPSGVQGPTILQEKRGLGCGFRTEKNSLVDVQLYDSVVASSGHHRGGPTSSET